VYVHLFLGGYNLYGSKSENLVLKNEEFQIPVVSGMEELIISVLSYKNNDKDRLLG
jgi:hypothetical protein